MSFGKSTKFYQNHFITVFWKRFPIETQLIDFLILDICADEMNNIHNLHRLFVNISFCLPLSSFLPSSFFFLSSFFSFLFLPMMFFIPVFLLLFLFFPFFFFSFLFFLFLLFPFSAFSLSFSQVF